MTTPNETKWGVYKGYEGPWFPGISAVKAPASPTEDEKTLMVVTATEGGRWDAVNAYDRMIISVGAIQWGEAGQYSVSDMLGKVADREPDLLAPLAPAMVDGIEFKRNAKGRWRFYLPDNEEVDTLVEQQRLFLNCDGHQGSWGKPDDPRRLMARTWVAAMANVFQQAEAQQAQAAYTVPRLRLFAMPNAKEALWGPLTPLNNDGWTGALRSAYLSFAANLPAEAAKQLDLALTTLRGVKPWSKEWCLAILKQLTFGPQIAIYPERYNKIRPKIEAIYGVDLPDLADELRGWHIDMGVDTSSAVPGFTRIIEIQQELVALGYDIGPQGADGIFGMKSKDALMTFQGLNRLKADGIIGPATRAALAASWVSRQT